MPVELDHFIVPCHNRVASARRLAELLGVDWQETIYGIFSPVYLNDGLTLDFVETTDEFPVHHYCFRVSETQFDAILHRIRQAGIAFRSHVRGPVNYEVCTEFGGRGVYWNEPDGHMWEMLTVSYARKPA